MVDLSDTAANTGSFNVETIFQPTTQDQNLPRNACKLCHKNCFRCNMLPPNLGYQTSSFLIPYFFFHISYSIFQKYKQETSEIYVHGKERM